MAKKLNFNQLLNKEDVDTIFNLEAEIASGSFGTVYRGKHLPSGKTMAVKIITPEKDEVPEDLMIEIAVLKQCKHRNIVEFFGGYRKGDEIFIALELCSCSVRDIFEYSEEPLYEKEIALICRETLKGLDYMHKNNLIHRDIKGANILLTECGEIKLVDFGVSSLNAKRAKTFVGTPYWMAPEIIEGKNTLSGYGPEIDIWALGITLIELAEVNPPLSYLNPMKALFQIPVRDSPTLEKKNHWSPLCHDFLSRCLEKNPRRRPSAHELLSHPFVRDCDEDPSILIELLKRKKKLEKGIKNEPENTAPFLSELPDFSALPNLNAMLPDLNPVLPDLSVTPKKKPIPSLTKNSKANASSNDLNQNMKKRPVGPTRSASQNDLSQSIAELPPLDPEIKSPKKKCSPKTKDETVINEFNNKNEKSKNDSDELLSGQRSPRNNSNGELTSSGLIQNDDLVSPLLQKSTLKRPTNQQNNKTAQIKANKHIIRQQMMAFKNLQVRLQKRTEKLEREHQRERDQFNLLIKRNIEVLDKKSESQKRSLERQHKLDIEGLVRSQQKEQRILSKHHENESKAIQRDIKDQIKVATKTHLDSQKNRSKDQKNELKEAKKKLSKVDVRILEKQHRIELQINELFFLKSQDRVKMIKEQDVIWAQQKDQHKNKFDELLQSQQMEMDCMKQIQNTNIEFHNELFSLKKEELNKLQPTIVRQLSELHQLQVQNLQQQLELEKSQQIALLLADQRVKQKDFRDKKRKMEKDLMNDLKGIEKSKTKTKGEIKNLQNEIKGVFQEKQNELDSEFEQEQLKQQQEEEEQMNLHQSYQNNRLLEKQKEELETLQSDHSKQITDIDGEEVSERNKMVALHKEQLKELQERLNKEQSDLLDIQHQELLMLMKRSQKSVIEFVETQRKELLSFIAINSDKILPHAQIAFNQQIDDHFNEVIEQLQREQQDSQRVLSAEMELQLFELQEQQRENNAKFDESLKSLDDSSAFVLVPVNLS